ncbi:LOW QUALITY PROTEIN: CKLF-like MARVEL transmembrane domain-containing protein 5 [Manacus candei]|uniref:LOW QUALITY PROTEIN: CKLF-like MARVEL transmembrane domain-containing protein 5 n=1 Tax=Manacus candei TaxID=415023 RepID=UPI0022279E83|nr:LOW QUALITY PROTEIN: CKLF-like MARVEL transmembrane domain-containing protein 5 [Manacus candei]
MGQPEPPGAFDLGGLRTPRGGLLGGELALCGVVVGLLAPPAPPTLAPALLQTLGGVVALGGILLRDPPRLPPGYGACLDLLRAVSGTFIFLVVALVALASSRDALAATTFTFSLVLAFVFAFDVFVTYRTRVGPALGQDPDMEET